MAFGVNATGLGVGTISKFVTACLGFRACLAAAAKAHRHTASRCRYTRSALPTVSQEHPQEPVRVPGAEVVDHRRRLPPGNRPGRRWRPP